MSRRRVVSAEERQLWRFVIRDAEPMPGRAVPVVPPLAEAVAAAPVTDDAQAKQSVPAPVPAKQPPAAAKPPPPLLPGQIHGVDRRTAERLRRGRLALDGRIDLHGMTQTEAHGALAAFVHRAWAEGRRCVLVITGKGQGGDGVLRRAVPRWLAEPALARMVLALQPAQPMHGGDGALYVLIKRRREGAAR